ncbi:SAM-dependent methyltransferase [Lentzea sp. NPDC004782]|uniref:SAM-dependent methyltransferase n=1 Tax=Lentzea sp. NPDC004782 TaxID=3154458 RepID=UPI0033A1C246
MLWRLFVDLGGKLLAGREERFVAVRSSRVAREFYSVPVCSARVHDYLLRGSNSFSADRRYADSFAAVQPRVRRLLRTERVFWTRAVCFMLDRGIRQFLDLGAGLPVHDGENDLAPFHGQDDQVRFVHIDSDPAAVAHGSMLLSRRSDNLYLQADAADVAHVVSACVQSGAIDVRRPVGILAVGLLHLIPPRSRPKALVSRYCSVFAPGSVAAITHLTPRFGGEHRAEAARLIAGPDRTLYPRSRAAVQRMFSGLKLVQPGLTLLSHLWRPGVPVSEFEGAQVEGLLGGLAVTN